MKNLDKMYYFKEKLKYQTWKGDVQNKYINNHILVILLKILLPDDVILKDLVIPMLLNFVRA